MSDYDRGAYTPPTEESFAFDAREPRVRRPAPATLLGSVIVLVVLVGAVGFFYWSGVRGANEAPQVVGKPALQIKSAPPVSDAKPIEDSDKLEVYDEEKGGQAAPASTKPAFAPPPEQPAPRGSLPAAQPTVQAAPLAPARPAATAQPAPIRQVPAAPAPAADDRSDAVAAAAARRTAAEARDTFGAAAPAPAPAKTVKAAKAAKAEPAAPAAEAPKGTMVQIGAFSSAAIADAEFAKAKAAFAAFTAGKTKHVERAEVGGKTYYRTAFAGFDRAGAHAFCKALLAAKKGCIVK